MNRAERRAQARGNRNRKQSCRLIVEYIPDPCPNCSFAGGGVYTWSCDDCGASGSHCIACAPPRLREDIERWWARDRARIEAQCARETARLNAAVGAGWRCADGLPEPVLTAFQLKRST